MPIDLRREEKRWLNLLQYEPHSTAILKSFDSYVLCVMVVENNQSLAAMLEEALASWSHWRLIHSFFFVKEVQAIMSAMKAIN